MEASNLDLPAKLTQPLRQHQASPKKFVIAVGPIMECRRGAQGKRPYAQRLPGICGGIEGQQSLTVLGTAISKQKSVEMHFCCNYKS